MGVPRDGRFNSGAKSFCPYSYDGGPVTESVNFSTRYLVVLHRACDWDNRRKRMRRGVDNQEGGVDAFERNGVFLRRMRRIS